MGIRYPIPQQTIGPAGIIGPMVEPELLKFALVVLSGGPVTISWVDEHGRASSWSVLTGGGVKFISTWSPPTLITGNGAVVAGMWMTPDDDVDLLSLFTGATNVNIISGSQLDPVNIVASSQGPGTVLAVQYTVPTGYKLQLNAVSAEAQNNSGSSRTVTLATIAVLPSAGPSYILANDGTGGAIANLHFYVIQAYPPTVTAQAIAGTVDAAVATAMTPQTLGPGDIIAVTVKISVSGTFIFTVGIDGILVPL